MKKKTPDIISEYTGLSAAEAMIIFERWGMHIDALNAEKLSYMLRGCAVTEYKNHLEVLSEDYKAIIRPIRKPTKAEPVKPKPVDGKKKLNQK